MIIFFVITLTALFLWIQYDRRRCNGYPPGPMRFPFIGNLIQLAKLDKLPYKAHEKLSERYGDVIYIRTGMADAVIFNNYETIKDMLAHEGSVDRSQTMAPLIWERMFHKNLGIVFSNRREWQSLRRFTIRTLRDFGFGKAACMDIVINEELEKFMEYLKQPEHAIGMEGSHLFLLTIINVIWRLVTGKEYNLNDECIKRLLQLSDQVFKSGNFGMDVALAFPFLYHLFPNALGKNQQLKDLKELSDFMQETIDNQRSKGTYKYSSNSYVDEFLLKIDGNAGVPNTEFTDEQLVLCLLDLFQAGSDTASNSLSFSMLYMIIYQNIQTKVQAEIDSNIGEDESIMLAMKDKLPFTFATLLESTRMACIAPFPPTRQAAQDFYFKGYLIKKGMPLVANLYGIHFNKNVWGDPYNFRPERFLTDGKVDMNVAGKFIPFGHGPRQCLAASLAENMLFLYFSTILRNFKVINAVPSQELSMEPVLGFTHTPKSFQVKFVPRR